MKNFQKYPTNTQVMTAWITDQSNTGINPKGSIFFEQGLLYSYGYHYLLAKHIVDEKTGTEVVLINCKKFYLEENRISRATEKQKEMLYHIVAPVCNIIPVSNPDGHPEQNLMYYNQQAEILSGLIIKARKKAKYLTVVQLLQRTVKAYLQAIGLPMPMYLGENLGYLNLLMYNVTHNTVNN